MVITPGNRELSVRIGRAGLRGIVALLACCACPGSSVSCGIYPNPTGNGSIAGTVRNSDGTALSAISVLVTMHDNAGDPLCWWKDTVADAAGQYAITDLPTGRLFSIAARTGQATVPSSPYRGTYYPGVATQDRAHLLRLGNGEARRGIDLTLEGPFPEREILVEVVWPDGRAVSGQFVTAVDQGGKPLRGVDTDSAGRAVFRVCQDTGYVFWTEWMSDGKSEVLHAEPVSAPPKAADHRLRLVLSSAGTFHDHHRGTLSLSPSHAPTRLPE